MRAIKLIRSVVYVVFLIAAVTIIFFEKDVLLSVFCEAPWSILSIVALSALANALQAANLWSLLPSQYGYISYQESLRIWCVGGLANLWMPLQAGNVTRLGLLASNGVSVKEGAAFLVDMVKSFCWVACVGLFPFLMIKSVFWGGIGVLVFFVLSFFYGKLFSVFLKHMKWGFLSLLLEVPSVMRDGGMLFRYVSILVVSALSISVCFSVFHIDITFANAVFVSSSVILSSLISLLPGNFGVQEAVLFFGTDQSVDLSILITVSIVFRLLNLIGVMLPPAFCILCSKAQEACCER